jgi:hypothetical protein
MLRIIYIFLASFLCASTNCLVQINNNQATRPTNCRYLHSRNCSFSAAILSKHIVWFFPPEKICQNTKVVRQKKIVLTLWDKTLHVGREREFFVDGRHVWLLEEHNVAIIECVFSVLFCSLLRLQKFLLYSHTLKEYCVAIPIIQREKDERTIYYNLVSELTSTIGW